MEGAPTCGVVGRAGGRGGWSCVGGGGKEEREEGEGGGGEMHDCLEVR